MEVWLLLDVSLLALLYVGGCMVCFGIPESLSATYYLLGKQGWLFSVYMSVVSVALYVTWFPLCEPSYQCLPFLSCASLLFVAAAPAFRLELEGRVHYGSAIVCCVCVVLWQILEGLWDVTLWFAWIGGMLSLSMKDKWCWWMEVAVVGSLIANLWGVVL